MLLDSVVITLAKNGVDSKPEYSITVYGDGRVVYEGFKNVEFKGETEFFVEKEKIVSLLNVFKDIDFFTLDDLYTDKKRSEGSSYVISLSTPIDKERMKKKTVTYYDKSRNVPQKLRGLERKIKELVKFNELSAVQQGGETAEHSKTTFLKVKKTHRSFNLERSSLKWGIIAGVVIIVLVAFLFYVFYSGLVNIPFNGSSKTPVLSITLLDTASYVRGFGDYDPSDSFKIGEKVYVYEEFSNFIVTDNNTRCNLFLNISVLHDDKEFYYNYYNVTQYRSYFESKVVNGFKWFFTPDDSWPVGEYEVQAFILDRNSGRSATAVTGFTLS